MNIEDIDKLTVRALTDEINKLKVERRDSSPLRTRIIDESIKYLNDQIMKKTGGNTPSLCELRGVAPIGRYREIQIK